MISALAFVPVANVIRDFNSLAAQCGLAKQPVLDYFENYWTNSGPEEMTQYFLQICGNKFASYPKPA